MEHRKDTDGKLRLTDRPVFMSVSFRGERLMLGTGLKADLRYWNEEEQRFRSSYSKAFSANIWLDTLSETARLTWEQISQANRDPGKQDFLDAFSDLKPLQSTGFLDVFLHFLEEGSQRWSILTYRKVKTIFKHLKEYEERKGSRLVFREMNKTFLKDFSEFYREKGNRESTTRAAISIIVWFLNWATGNGYNTYHEYRSFYRLLGKIGPKTVQTRFLNREELKKLRELPCASRKMERTRDLFCLMCFTGIRFSELSQIAKEDVSTHEILIRKKGGKTRKVPLNNQAADLVSVYENRYFLNNRAFPQMSLITFNKYLRILTREAGVARDHDESPTAGWAVNTFIANALSLDVHPDLIPGFTGVKQDSRITRIRNELLRNEVEKLNLPLLDD